MSKTDVVKKEAAGLPAVAMDFAADAMMGFENVTAKDVAIPYLKILQALSPELRGVTKVPGAEEGMVMNTVTNQMMSNFRVIPCAFRKSYVEWTPREAGGGLVREHDDDSILSQTKKNERGQDVLPNGNLIVTTAYHYVLVVTESGVERAVMAMSSTQLKKSRRWLGQQMAIQVKVGDKTFTPPPFSHTYHVATSMETKDTNSWFGWVINDPQMVTDKDLYETAKKFGNDVLAGLVKISEPPVEGQVHAEDTPY